VPCVIPESNPPGFPPDAARYVHGAAKEDWETEWGIPLEKKNVIIVPLGAVILAGSKESFCPRPTFTLMCPGVFAGADGALAAAVADDDPAPLPY